MCNQQPFSFFVFSTTNCYVLYYTPDIIMDTRWLQCVLHNSDAIRLISSGSNICSSSHGILVAYKNEHIHQYSALPTNTQFTERGVKEYGFVSLGRRCEHNRSILAIARGRILPEELLKGRDILESKKEAGVTSSPSTIVTLLPVYMSGALANMSLAAGW